MTVLTRRRRLTQASYVGSSSALENLRRPYNNLRKRYRCKYTTPAHFAPYMRHPHQSLNYFSRQRENSKQKRLFLVHWSYNAVVHGKGICLLSPVNFSQSENSIIRNIFPNIQDLELKIPGCDFFSVGIQKQK